MRYDDLMITTVLKISEGPESRVVYEVKVCNEGIKLCGLVVQRMVINGT